MTDNSLADDIRAVLAKHGVGGATGTSEQVLTPMLVNTLNQFSQMVHARDFKSGSATVWDAIPRSEVRAFMPLQAAPVHIKEAKLTHELDDPEKKVQNIIEKHLFDVLNTAAKDRDNYLLEIFGSAENVVAYANQFYFEETPLSYEVEVDRMSPLENSYRLIVGQQFRIKAKTAEQLEQEMWDGK